MNGLPKLSYVSVSGSGSGHTAPVAVGFGSAEQAAATSQHSATASRRIDACVTERVRPVALARDPHREIPALLVRRLIAALVERATCHGRALRARHERV